MRQRQRDAPLRGNGLNAVKKMWELACLRWRCISQKIGCRYTAIAGKPAPTLDLWRGSVWLISQWPFDRV
ncbi:hypothetical protein AO063_12910 [Pseudomonas fluorescens ICMP 11288]|uniref:Uncharacterized protein n=1 Tax=Pseudomonas fluorescens ICMP 11288 TaxID=1198309 RepID=A0A0W0I0T5_PSEFL|nr:hypothetical protein AO063_12910 [Pseudomonas fluorescens ICMP 11288]